MVHIIVSFPNGLAHLIHAHDIADDTTMHTLSAMVHTQQNLQAANYVHLGLCRPIADQQGVPIFEIQTEIVRLSEITTVAEAMVLADEHVDVDVVGPTDVLSLVGHVGIVMIPPPG
ncbi:hypothetical protein TCAL_04291 [Tigriopus californicus]|uniref:Uncharacterized protein n=1 Tax=Tigriopus californicus TaxID=6832 RepID=A0A553NE53_TIGCA|nr:uncharacterized protein LOC131888551 [Tigriopus californicus]TRY63726.1 hypothetical protein TCAL_04291 [Tigriopus californicus]|eukprot:TCALIF_04291-PA protein Name:"Protein of unknown function" AED:0.00 eAED:0.00 QI:83/1/0.66/1/1/1/3/173/115